MTEKITQTLYCGEVVIDFYPNSHRYRVVKDSFNPDMVGKSPISVTAAVGMLDKSGALVPWAIKQAKNYLINIVQLGEKIDLNHIEEACLQHEIKKEAAADVGSVIHKWCESYAKGLNPQFPQGDDEKSEKVMNGILAFLRWVEQNDVKFVATEQFVYSKKYRYIGTMDLIFTMGREDHRILHVGDYKTTSGIYNSALYQVSGYQNARMEEIDGNFGSLYILRFQKEDKFDKDGKLKEPAGHFEPREITVQEHQKNLECFLACLRLKERDKEFQSLFYNSRK